MVVNCMPYRARRAESLLVFTMIASDCSCAQVVAVHTIKRIVLVRLVRRKIIFLDSSVIECLKDLWSIVYVELAGVISFTLPAKASSEAMIANAIILLFADWSGATPTRWAIQCATPPLCVRHRCRMGRVVLPTGIGCYRCFPRPLN